MGCYYRSKNLIMSEIPRIFVDKQFINTDTGIILIDDTDNFHYLKNVLRLAPSDQVIVLDACYNQFLTTVSQINKKSLELNIQEKQVLPKYPAIDINLFQAITKGDTHEFIIQKATELGVKSINSVITEFSNVKLKDTTAIQSKLDRWKKVATGASQQSKRATIPEITFFDSLEDIFNKSDCFNDRSLNLVCFEDHSVPSIKSYLKSLEDKPDSINLFIGPEGGWSNSEASLFDKYHLNKVSLGNNILRSETATILSLGFLLYEFEFK